MPILGGTVGVMAVSGATLVVAGLWFEGMGFYKYLPLAGRGRGHVWTLQSLLWCQHQRAHGNINALRKTSKARHANTAWHLHRALPEHSQLT